MSASTPAARGGFSTQHLRGSLAAGALAIVFVGGLFGLQAASTRNQAAAPAPGVTVNRVPIATSPYAVPGDHGWIADGGKLATPMFAVPGDHAAATEGGSVMAPTFIELPRPFDPASVSGPTFIELPRPFDPASVSDVEAPVGGGRGTRMPR